MMKYALWMIPLMLSANAVASAQDQAVPWIKSKQRLTILSANDGQVHLRTGTDAKKVTADSITVIHLGPDHPPIVKTVYGTVPNTISGPPYMAMTGDSARHTLIDVVAEAELKRQRAEAMLDSDEGMDAIKEAEGLSRRFRVDGVPFFIINGKTTLAGAQQSDAFLDAFRKVAQN